MLPGLSRVQRAAKNASPALKFVLMVGIMSFFADFTYEGSRSITGPYLGLLGAGAFTISAVHRRLRHGLGGRQHRDRRPGQRVPGGLVVFSVASELAAIPLIFIVRARTRPTGQKEGS
jgi:hypothetical protein